MILQQVFWSLLIEGIYFKCDFMNDYVCTYPNPGRNIRAFVCFGARDPSHCIVQDN